MVETRKMALVIGLTLMSGTLAIHADSPVVLAFDTPTMVEGVETVCTAVILAPEDFDRWLSALEPGPRDLLKPYPAAPLTI